MPSAVPVSTDSAGTGTCDQASQRAGEIGMNSDSRYRFFESLQGAISDNRPHQVRQNATAEVTRYRQEAQGAPVEVFRDHELTFENGDGMLKNMDHPSKTCRVFYASDATPNTWFANVRSNIWRNNLLLPLRDLGHDVVEFEYDLTQTFRNLDATDSRQAAFIAENRPKVSAALLRQVRAAHAAAPIDLFFSYFYDACILPEMIDEIRAMGIKTVNWYCNGSYQLHLVREISPRYDFCLVPEKFRMGDYLAMGAGRFTARRRRTRQSTSRQMWRRNLM